jgi:transcriptional regulator with XRE-family HTH domain
VSIEPDRQGQQRKDLATALKELRQAAGLSGERLAVRCAMSQTKISRIETGTVLPSLTDVERILSALEVPREVADELLKLARAANVDYVSWRTYARVGLWQQQAELKALAESSTVVRQFLPAMPTGLLQIPDYATLALSPTVPSAPARDVAKAVHARMERQAVLDDPNRRFIFLLTEQAVRWRYASDEVMARQVAHMAEVSTKSNVEIAIIPQSAQISSGALNIFVIYDDRLVLVELFSGEVVLRDPRDVSFHLDLFGYFLSQALTGSAATAFLHAVAEEFMRLRD